MTDSDAPPAKPVPAPDPETQPYWDAAAQRALKLPRCRDCARFVFPPRPVCPNCLRGPLEWTELSGGGKVYSFAVMRETYMKGFHAPYIIAQIELDEQPGLRIAANILDCDPAQARIGMRVAVVFEERGGGVVVPQFRPAGDPDG